MGSTKLKDIEYKPGTLVRVKGLRHTWEIIDKEGNNGNILVATGSVKIWIEADKLLPVFSSYDRKNPKGLRNTKAHIESRTLFGTVSVDLHGVNAIEARALLNKALSHALEHNNRIIEVIHGKGNGILMRVTLNYFNNCPEVIKVETDCVNPSISRAWME